MSDPVNNSTSDKRIIDQLDRLQQLAIEGRDDFYGDSWIEEVKRFYNMDAAKAAAPSFRPRVDIPQLQVLALNEVTDLTDADPKIYITDFDGKRLRNHEKSLLAQWRQGFYNNRILHAELWAYLSGMGYIQVGLDPTANRGRGEVWCADRDPGSVYIDPAARNEEDWSYVQIEDRVYLESVRQRWPERGRLVQPHSGSKATPESGYGFSMPPGPMSVVSGLPSEKGPGDGRVRLRWTYVKDPSRAEVKIPKDVAREIEKLEQLAVPQYKPLYPNHRLIVDCEGVVLADGANPFPCKLFPLIPFRGMPALSGFYPPPPTRSSKSLQELAGRMLTQLFESAVRVNNAQVFIPDNCGIDPQDYGGLPGEVHVINGQSQPPTAVWGQPLPEHYLKLPQLLLDKQKELQGFTPSRMGEPGAGNISQELYQGSIWQSKTLTRLRGRLMAESIQRLAELVFYTMAKFYKNQPHFPQFPEAPDQDFSTVPWDDISGNYEDYQVYLDPGSIRPLSAAAMRMQVPMLRQLGLVDTRTALEMLDIPGAAEIADSISNEQKLAALAQVKQRK